MEPVEILLIPKQKRVQRFSSFKNIFMIFCRNLLNRIRVFSFRKDTNFLSLQYFNFLSIYIVVCVVCKDGPVLSGSFQFYILFDLLFVLVQYFSNRG